MLKNNELAQTGQKNNDLILEDFISIKKLGISFSFYNESLKFHRIRTIRFCLSGQEQEKQYTLCSEKHLKEPDS